MTVAVSNSSHTDYSLTGEVKSLGKGGCFKCGGFGHIARDCSTPDAKGKGKPKGKGKTRANEAWAKQASSAATARSVDIPKRSAPCFTQSSERKERTMCKKKQKKKQIADYWKYALMKISQNQ